MSIKLYFFTYFVFIINKKSLLLGQTFSYILVFKADLHKEGISHKILLLQFLFLLIFLHPDNFAKPDK